MASDPGMETDESVRRKRPGVPIADYALGDSDSETETECRATAKARRGKTARGRGAGLARARAELKERCLEAKEEAFERSLRNRAFKKTMPATCVDPEESSSSEIRNIEDSSKLTAEELRADAGRSAAAILEVAQKSRTLNGPYIKRLKDAASKLQEIVDALAERTEADETRRLRADNGRLRREIDNLKAELKAHRREFTDMRAAMSAVSAPAPSTIFDENIVEELKASIVSSIGVMIDSRFAGIEERLLPAKTLRPPLAADRRQEVAPTSQIDTASQSMAAASGMSAPSRRKKKAAPKEATSSATTQLAGPPCVPSELVPLTSNDGEGEWVKVVKKGKKKPSPAGAPINTVTATPIQRAPQPPKPKLAPPRTAAIIVTLQPEAVGKGVTYAHVLERASHSINLGELGISDGIRVRRAATGARLLELPKSQSPEVAELLAEKLRTTLDGVASVVRPTKSVEIKITGLDDSISKKQVASAIALAGNCSVEAVKPGDIRLGPGGMGMVVARCPIATAKKLSEAGRLLVGWSSTRVQALEQRPLRCFKCMVIGHTSALCPSGTDRSKLCFRCGRDGHKSYDCTGVLCCAVCKDAGKPSGHVMGGRNCSPPVTKGKVATGTLTTTTGCSNRQVQEEAAMSS